MVRLFCSYDRCWRLRKPNTHYTNLYCHKHSCSSLGCIQYRLEGSLYCDYHTCPVHNCFSRSVNKEKACIEHTSIFNTKIDNDK